MKYLLPLIVISSALAVPLPHSGAVKSPPARINGGGAARAGQFPFAAAIYYQTDPAGYYFCSGALISNLWVLTAARCVENAVTFTMYFGTNHLNDTNRVTAVTSQSLAHPDYDTDTFENDLALIKLRFALTFGDFVQQIYLPGNPLEDGSQVTAIGWGQINDEQSGIVNELQFVPIVTLSNQECQVSYSTPITDSMVCAEGNNNEGTCSGDLGGPLVRYQPRAPTLHVGISSFTGPNGCESVEPSGYTRTFQYVPWIRENTQITN